MDETHKFYKQRHVKFFSRCLDVLPNAYQTLDTNRMTVLFFAIFGLDILGELESVIDENRRKDVISWVYSLQALNPRTVEADDKNGQQAVTKCEERLSNLENGLELNGSNVNGSGSINDCSNTDNGSGNNSSSSSSSNDDIDRISSMLGFRSSPGNGARLSSANLTADAKISSADAKNSSADLDNSTAEALSSSFEANVLPTQTLFGSPVDNLFDSSHVTMTYNALAILLILKDDLRGVDRKAVLRGLKHLQQPDGSFSPMCDGGERDMRFVFCAAAICSILADDRGEGMDVQKAADFVISSLTYEGAFGMCAYAEAHGGSSFCALASLVLMNSLRSSLSDKRIRELKRWLCFRQERGFQGRANKPVDCCYSFWVGASLKLLDAFSLAQITSNVQFTLSCQNPITGGFAKWPDCNPDALHACLGLAGLSLLENENSGNEMKEGDSLPKLGLRPIYPSLNITSKAFQHLLLVQQSWKQ